MNRRSFLRGLLALPFVGVAVKHLPKPWVPWMGVSSWRGGWIRTSSLGGGRYPVGIIDKYTMNPSSMRYSEVEGIEVWPPGSHTTYISTGSYPEQQKNPPASSG